MRVQMVTFAIDPRKSAVVAIDLQNCNVEKSPIAAPLGLQVVDKLNLLAARYRAAGSTIIWTRHVVRPDHSGALVTVGCTTETSIFRRDAVEVTLPRPGTGRYRLGSHRESRVPARTVGSRAASG